MVEVITKDEKLNSYIIKVHENLGVFYKNVIVDDSINISENWKQIERETFLSFYGTKNPYIEIYKNINGDYLAVYFQSYMDGFTFTVWKSNKYLNVKRVRTSLLSLESMEIMFRFRKPLFTCWECGRKDCHILDIDGSLQQKIDKFEDECCCE
ncbi:hypothetical protein [Ornithinibacillus sp. JPR2-1]|uniref:hypothetical protein n=1 Tax=Ornithinibacillus sp. JPR2-1 TaxID=2094019 RepID=UPI0031CE9918